MSVRQRAAVAVLLTIGFYGLALAIAAGLLAVPYLEYTATDHVVGRLAFYCIAGAVIILWSIAPRRVPFAPPGPRLDPDSQPHLFREIADVAQRVGERMPAEVYLVPDVNAAVTQRGGFGGAHARRIMLIGLPLVQVLTVAELRAVLAHEFGHYHGGDTRLGPWVYRTREAIGRTLERVGRHSRMLRKPFQWYGLLFLRVTQAVSRRQEFAADELAARVVGAGPMISGLRAIAGASPAYDAYLREEFAPAVNAGFAPPMADGFRRFLGQPRIAEAVSRAVEAQLATPRTDPYDSHPPIAERIGALERLPVHDVDGADGRPAAELLERPGDLEERLIAGLRRGAGPSLRPLAWEDAGTTVVLPAMRQRLARQGTVLAGATGRALPGLAADARRIGTHVAVPQGSPPDPETATRLGIGLLGTALAVMLAAQGWRVVSLPGEPVTLTLDDASLDPYQVVEQLRTGEVTPATWEERAVSLGIADLPLTPTR